MQLSEILFAFVLIFVSHEGFVKAYKYGRTYDHVFSISWETVNYGMTFDSAKGACEKSNAVIATYGQVEAAWKNGFEECNCGWVSDNKAFYPIFSSPAPKGCGTYSPRMKHCTGRNKWNGYCYSKKKQCYKKFTNTASKGGAIFREREANSLDSCKTVCDAQPKCVGFDYNPKTKRCWKHETVNLKTHRTGIDQYINCHESQCYEKYTDIYSSGGASVQQNVANSLDSCKRFCNDANPKCVGFDYDPKTKRCWKHETVNVQMGMKGIEQYLKCEVPIHARHIGCYRDDTRTLRDLDASIIHWADKMSPRRCIDYCYRRRFKYAALQDGELCLCDNKYGKYGKVSQNECSKPCLGIPQYKCGSTLRNDVYDTGAPSPKKSCKENPCQAGEICMATKDSFVCTCPIGEKFNFEFKSCLKIEKQDEQGLGCFKDNTPIRDLDGKRVQWTYNTPEKCMAFCFENKYLYAGMQGTSCSCGNAYGRYGKAEWKKCDVKCTGNSNLKCGAALYSNVYRSGYKACSTNPCPSNRRCVDTRNGFWCSCLKGEVFNERTQKCQQLSGKNINQYYSNAFDALRSGSYNKINEFVNSINPIFRDVQQICQSTKDKDSCNLLEVLSSMKLQSKIASQYSNSKRRVLFFEDQRFENVDLRTYLNELQEHGIASQLLYDVSKGINMILDQNHENAKALGEYLKSVAQYETAIAVKDKEYLDAKSRKLLAKSQLLRSKITKNLEVILIAALSAGAFEILDRIASVATEIAIGISGLIDILPEFPNPNDIKDRAEQLSAAIGNVAELGALLTSVKDLSKYGAELGEKYLDQEQQMTTMNNLLKDAKGEFGVETQPLSSDIVNSFIKNYGDFTPRISLHDIEQYTAQIETVASAACDIYASFESVHAQTLHLTHIGARDACRHIVAYIAELAVLYEEIYDFQFELIDTYADIVRGSVAMTYAENLGSDVSRIDMYKLIQGMILDQTHMQKVATVFCNQLEYQNGGFRPDACTSEYHDAEAIRTIISTTVGVETNGDEVTQFAYLPTTLEAKKNEKNIAVDVNALLTGKEVQFSLPRQNPDWMFNNRWTLFKNDLESRIVFIKKFEPFIPGLSCAKYTRISVRSAEKTSLYDEPFSVTYAIPPTQIVSSQWVYNQLDLSKSCASSMVYDIPTGKDETKTESICSNSKANGRRPTILYPALFTEKWIMKVEIENCSPAEIKAVASKLKHIPVRLDLLSIELHKENDDSNLPIYPSPNFCFPNPCENGGLCTNHATKNTFVCKCQYGATGYTCDKIEDKCAKKTCVGGTCVNILGQDPYCDCGKFQIFSNQLRRCVPSNCAVRRDFCGSATCIDTYHGPECVCKLGYVYSNKACKKDHCHQRVCGSATCTSTNGGATCTCKDNAAFDSKSKSCKNACQANSCPRDAKCSTVLTGYYRVPEKRCQCNGANRIYWSKENKCADDFCKKSPGMCGLAKCVNKINKAVCVCPAKTKFMKDKTCQPKKCDVGGKPPYCGNYYDKCKKSGREVCDNWKGGCWGTSKQFRCCNYCHY